MAEATFMVDNLNQNKLLEGVKEEIQQLYQLITMYKGTDPLNPDKGVGIENYKYDYADNGILINLENEISEQIRKYTPYLSAEIGCKAIKNVDGDYILHVFIMLPNLETAVVDISTNGKGSSLALIKI